MRSYLQVMERAPLSPEVFVALLTGYFASCPRETSSYAGIPVQILYSEADRVTPWEQHGAIASRAVPYALIGQIDGGSHFVHLQKPQHTADSIVSFLSRC